MCGIAGYIGPSTAAPIILTILKRLEGALKLKEISYIHAEGYPGGETKHGPIALIEPGMPVVVVAPLARVYSKLLSNVEEIKARGAIVIGVGTEGDTDIASRVNHFISAPANDPFLSPLLTVVPSSCLPITRRYAVDARSISHETWRRLLRSNRATMLTSRYVSECSGAVVKDR